jgi:hypothetical protein
MNQWKNFTDGNGNFQLANYIYRSINDLMKHALDMGTLLSNDQQKLRAYKEQTKKLFKARWYEIAECLEGLDLIEKCSCFTEDREIYCDICKGSRYKLSQFLTSDEIREVSLFVNNNSNYEIAQKLQKGLMQVLNELSEM